MKPPPGGLVPGQRRPRVLRIAAGVDWYVVDRGRFALVGSGDVSLRDLKAVDAELAASGSGGAVFVCVARPKEIEEVLGPKGRLGIRRITWSQKMKTPIAPTLSAVARGARIALLPGVGPAWVDGERLFTPGETVPLPWMDPPLALPVVRPRQVLRALGEAVGHGGPKRADLGLE
ncbi:MAG: hypothetical protein ACYDGN_11960 [Acidimicrobiales bacterium]